MPLSGLIFLYPAYLLITACNCLYLSFSPCRIFPIRLRSAGSQFTLSSESAVSHLAASASLRVRLPLRILHQKQSIDK